MQDNYKIKLFVMDSKHWELNVYTIKLLSGKVPMCMVNWWQLCDLQKSEGDNLLDQAPDTILPIMLAKKTHDKKISQIKSSIWYKVQDQSKFYTFRLIFRG